MTAETFVGIVLPLLIGILATGYYFYGRRHGRQERLRGFMLGRMRPSSADFAAAEKIKAEAAVAEAAAARRAGRTTL